MKPIFVKKLLQTLSITCFLIAFILKEFFTFYRFQEITKRNNPLGYSFTTKARQHLFDRVVTKFGDLAAKPWKSRWFLLHIFTYIFKFEISLENYLDFKETMESDPISFRNAEIDESMAMEAIIQKHLYPG